MQRHRLLIGLTVALLWCLQTIAVQAADDKNPNRFYRLTKPKSERNPPLAKDGIHDPAAEGLSILQAPKTAFSKLSHGKSGNYVDWMKSMTKKQINPRYSYEEGKQPMPMQLDIIRQVKGSTPDVLFPIA